MRATVRKGVSGGQEIIPGCIASMTRRSRTGLRIVVMFAPPVASLAPAGAASISVRPVADSAENTDARGTALGDDRRNRDPRGGAEHGYSRSEPNRRRT